MFEPSTPASGETAGPRRVLPGMDDMLVVDNEREFIAELDEPEAITERPRLRTKLWILLRAIARAIASIFEWIFGAISLVLGLSFLAAIPVRQRTDSRLFPGNVGAGGPIGPNPGRVCGRAQGCAGGRNHGGNLALTGADLVRRRVCAIG